MATRATNSQKIDTLIERANAALERLDKRIEWSKARLSVLESFDRIDALRVKRDDALRRLAKLEWAALPWWRKIFTSRG